MVCAAGIHIAVDERGLCHGCGRNVNVPIVGPRVHIGGTAPVDLTRGYEEAIRALLIAQQRINDTWPHARDYIGDAAAWDKATQQHKTKMDRVDDVVSELEELLRQVNEQIEQRRQTR